MLLPRDTISSLEELKRRLDQAKDIVVNEEGKLHLPDDPEIKKKETEGKKTTTIKPTRWFWARCVSKHSTCITSTAEF